jgi:hypothetical protein
MPSQKNNDLLIKGGLIALLIFLLRKAGTSAPLPGDTFGGTEAKPSKTRGKGDEDLVSWANTKGKILKAYWNGPSGQLYGYLSPNDILNGNKDYTIGGTVGKKNMTIKNGQFLGYVTQYDTSTFNNYGSGLGVATVLIQGTESKRDYGYDFKNKGNLSSEIKIINS